MSSVVKTIDKVVEQAHILYSNYIESDYIAVDIKVDGAQTRGQCKDQTNAWTLKEECTKEMTCELEIPVHRGSYIQMKKTRDDTDYTMAGIVLTTPTETPVDFLYNTLFFNTVVKRYRKDEVFDTDGNVIGDNPLKIDKIDCFVQRVGMRERQIDAGIDRNSVNQLITIKSWDIKINDLLYVGNNKYIVTDIEELDEDILSLYMTYYRG